MNVERCLGEKLVNNNQKRMSNHEYKQMLKRIWICVACLIPVILLLTYLFSVVKIPVWLAMVLNVIIGGIICLLVFIISDKIQQKKKARRELGLEDTSDPFAD